MSGKYALIIGNTEYNDPGLAQLTAPGNDTEDFARVLKAQNLCGFDDVRVLLNELSSSVIEVIDEFFDQKKPDDLLVLYFSGHGVRDEFGSLYLALKNTIRTRLRSTAIKDDYIRGAMDQSRSKRQVVILDCCNSGAFPQGTKAEAGGSMGLIQAFQGYGRFVLTASDATQFAWEGEKIIGETDNSLFTHFLVKGLEGEADLDSDGKITVDELYDYAYDQISKLTAKQTPTKSSSKVAGEMILRQFTRMEDIKPVALPEDLISEIEDLRPYVREAAVQKLDKILKGKNIGLARSAVEALEKMAADDNTTRRVAQLAMAVLEAVRQAEQKAAEESLAREQADQLMRAKAEREAAERESAEKPALEAAEKAAREKVERETAEREANELTLTARRTAEKEAKEKVASSQGTTIGTQTLIHQPTLKWAVIGIIGLCILGAAAWGISYLAGLSPSSPTEGFNTSVPATEDPNTEASSTAAGPAGPVAPSEKIQVRWFVGLGGGVGNQQIAVQEEVVADFNASQDNIELVLEVVPNFDNQSISAFSAQIASGNGPDIIGPVGLDYSNAFSDEWLDLAPYISETSFNLVSDPALRTFFQSEVGQLGLAVGVYPSAVYYVPSLFDQAGLNYPPDKYGDRYVMPDGTVVDWDWDTLTQIARLLTIDANGRNPSDTGFDRNQIVQVGLDFQWLTGLKYVASYRAGAATIVQNNLPTIPASWKEAMEWYYDGMWGDQPFIANAALASSPDFGSGNPFNSGKVAMAITPLWYACCPDEFLLNNGVQFQFAALPVGDDGKVHGRVDVDTFRIWKGSKHPEEAFEVLSYLMTTGAEKLLPVYGAIPAIPAQRDAFFAKKYADYPFVTQESWDVFLQGLAYPDIPSADQYQPNWREAHQRDQQFFVLIRSTPPSDWDFDTEWQKMIDDLNVIYGQ